TAMVGGQAQRRGEAHALATCRDRGMATEHAFEHGRTGPEQADDEHRRRRAVARTMAGTGNEAGVATGADRLEQAQVAGDVVAQAGTLGPHAALEFGPCRPVFAEVMQLVEQGVAEVDVVLAARRDARAFGAQARDSRPRAI